MNIFISSVGGSQAMMDPFSDMINEMSDTPETLEACRYVKERGCTVVSVISKKDSELEKISDYSFVYEEGRHQELIMYLLVGKILFNKGYFLVYPKFAEKYSNKVTVFECKDFTYPNISDIFRPLHSPVVMNAILQRISKNMEVITNHSLDIRRYPFIG